MIPYNHTKFRVETHQGAGTVGKNLGNPGNLEKLSWGGQPLGDNSTYLLQHRRDITQAFIVDSPNDALQTHKVSGRNSPRGRIGGQKSLETPEKVMKSCPSEDRGRARPYNHRTTEP